MQYVNILPCFLLHTVVYSLPLLSNFKRAFNQNGINDIIPVQLKKAELELNS